MLAGGSRGYGRPRGAVGAVADGFGPPAAAARQGITLMDTSNRPVDPQVRIGHVHLKVADLERALRFYCGVLGFAVTQRDGTQTAFVSAGVYHHRIGLNTWESRGGSPPPPGATGLYHTAVLYPTRAALADALRLVPASRWTGPPTTR